MSYRKAMTPNTIEKRTENNSRSVIWLGAAVGATVGVAALAYGRKQRSPWERAVDRAHQLADSAREEVRPWMGVAAATAGAASALMAYSRAHRQSGWQRTQKRIGEFASRVEDQARPWGDLALSAAVGLASLAYARKARRRTIRGINESTAERINFLAEKGLQIARHLRDIPQQASKLRHVLA